MTVKKKTGSARLDREIAQALSHEKDARQLLERALKYVGKGLEMGAYTATVGGDLFAERLLEQIQRFLRDTRR